MIPKFRAWHKELKMMFEVKSLVYTLRLARLENRNNVFPSRTCSFDDIILMQSTGLKDKNDTEIFEGDVVEYIDGEFSFIGKVIKSTLGTYVTGIDNHSFEDFTDETTMISDVSVVGNIYENPELLESVEE